MPGNTLLFLDMDGVLNRIGYLGDFTFNQHALAEVEVRLVRRLAYQILLTRQILNENDYELNVVISSSWRKIFSLEEFLSFGDQLPDFKPITDLMFRDEQLWRTRGSRSGYRGVEIQDYLDDIFPNPVSSYVILDDNSDFFPYQPLVLTNMYEGFRQADAAKMHAFLTKCIGATNE